MTLKRMIFAAALTLSVGSGSANAATYNINFDEMSTGVGIDWVGTFEAPASGGALTSFSVEISGVTYSVLNNSGAIAGSFPTYDSILNTLVAINPFLNAIVTNVPFIAGALALTMTGSGVFGKGICGDASCSASLLGTYSITEATAVPIPGALPLLGAALVGLALVGAHRGRRASYIG